MARGWESKAVEAQQAEREGAATAGPGLSVEERARRARREAAALALARASDDLARATRPAHREMLERAIAALNAELSGL
jgi:hypothetical protein